MLTTTLQRLRCPVCSRELSLAGQTARTSRVLEAIEIRSGQIECRACRASFPILGGVAVLVTDPASYLLEHVKGIAQVVPDSEIPPEYLSDYLEAKSELAPEHIEEDLEAERVISLYLMNHYLTAAEGVREAAPWWIAESGKGSPLIDALIREHWDHGPLERIGQWVAGLSKGRPAGDAIELGCGVGGLYRRIRPHATSYLGVDSSFASIALGRHLALGVPYSRELRVPRDLLQGSVSNPVKVAGAPSMDGQADLIVGDLENLPVERGSWDLALALNAIDMLPEPAVLPRTQHELLREGGVAIQSCPYIWHEVVARELRGMLPADIRESARAVEWLYEQAGFRIDERIEQLPWLFFKHVRQLEIYSVHLFRAFREELPTKSE